MTAPKPVEERRKPGPKPRPRANPELTKPTGKPVLLDRWMCGHCGKLRPVAAVAGERVLADHLAFIRDETHPCGGEHGQCPGSGKPGMGYIVHNAALDSRY